MKFLFGFLRSLVDANRGSDAAPDPASAESHNNSGVALHARHDYAGALASFERAVQADAGYAEGWFNRGTSLHALGRIAEAVESYSRAIALRPGHVGAHFNLGVAQKEAGDLAAAVGTLARGVQIDPGFPFLYGTWLEAKLRACDWDGLDAAFVGLKERIARGEKAATPQVVAMPVTAAEQKRAVTLWANEKYPPGRSLPALARQPLRERAHVGYFSADFHDHATANLIAELFERHDKSRFELTAFTFGPDKGDAMQSRVLAAFDRVVDVRSMPDAEAAAAARLLGVEIAVDLKGFTAGARTGIFAERAAPIQVAYLGYPGTMGLGYMDYLLADRTLIPAGDEAHYAEKIARLPHSYQANDSTRAIPENGLTRKDAGLPAEGFVFCCFNNNYKILPQVFEAWMRILRAVPRSLLWLLEDNPVAMQNLRREAAARGIDSKRLIFARRVTQPEHLARQRLADLFLDTLPCNAHTTASDALWAGVPLITLPGETFAGRVAASLLNAMHLPELVVASIEDYERCAIGYANDPGRLKSVRSKLAANRGTAPLFDTKLFTRHIEAAYTAMRERHSLGLPPAPIDVPA